MGTKNGWFFLLISSKILGLCNDSKLVIQVFKKYIKNLVML